MSETESRPQGGMFRLIVGVIIALGWFALAGVLIGWVNRSRGYPGRPIWGDALFGVYLGASTLVIIAAQRRGWIPNWFASREGVKAKQRELAKEREEILENARRKTE